VDVTVWKAVYAERCTYRLGRGRWKRAGVRHYLKGFQTGQHILQYLASCLLYFIQIAHFSFHFTHMNPLNCMIQTGRKSLLSTIMKKFHLEDASSVRQPVHLKDGQSETVSRCSKLRGRTIASNDRFGDLLLHRMRAV
jgi:hypothetical protein